VGNKSDSAISRREFARRAAFVSAAASLSSSNLLSSESIAAALPAQQPVDAPKLSPEGQAEIDRGFRPYLLDTALGSLTLRKPIFGG